MLRSIDVSRLAYLPVAVHAVDGNQADFVIKVEHNELVSLKMLAQRRRYD